MRLMIIRNHVIIAIEPVLIFLKVLIHDLNT